MNRKKIILIEMKIMNLDMIIKSLMKKLENIY